MTRIFGRHKILFYFFSWKDILDLPKIRLSWAPSWNINTVCISVNESYGIYAHVSFLSVLKPSGFLLLFKWSFLNYLFQVLQTKNSNYNKNVPSTQSKIIIIVNFCTYDILIVIIVIFCTYIIGYKKSVKELFRENWLGENLVKQNFTHMPKM